MRKIYIATRLERAGDHKQLSHALSHDGNEVTYDWTKHGSVKSEGVERIREVSIAEVRGVQESDAVIVLLPGGRGTHVELGVAIGFSKPIIIHAEEKHGFFADDERTCAFYHHPLVHRVQSPWGICFVEISDILRCIEIS